MTRDSDHRFGDGRVTTPFADARQGNADAGRYRYRRYLPVRHKAAKLCNLLVVAGRSKNEVRGGRSTDATPATLDDALSKLVERTRRHDLGSWWSLRVRTVANKKGQISVPPLRRCLFDQGPLTAVTWVLSAFPRFTCPMD